MTLTARRQRLPCDRTHKARHVFLRLRQPEKAALTWSRNKLEVRRSVTAHRPHQDRVRACLRNEKVGIEDTALGECYDVV
jgi:hypothetical protein